MKQRKNRIEPLYIKGTFLKVPSVYHMKSFPLAANLKMASPSKNNTLLIFTLVVMIKNPPANAGDVGLIPGLERSHGAGNGNPLQYSCLENPMYRGALWATLHGVAKSQTRLSYWAPTQTSAMLGLQGWVAIHSGLHGTRWGLQRLSLSCGSGIDSVFEFYAVHPPVSRRPCRPSQAKEPPQASTIPRLTWAFIDFQLISTGEITGLDQWFSTKSRFAPQGTRSSDFHLALTRPSCSTLCLAELPGVPWHILSISVFAYSVLTTVKVPPAPAPLFFSPANYSPSRFWANVAPSLECLPWGLQSWSFHTLYSCVHAQFSCVRLFLTL